MNDLFAVLYELFIGQTSQLANLLYKDQTYIMVGVSMVLISLFGVILFYYIINHPRFNKWFPWLITVIFFCLINFVIAYFKADGVVWNTYESTDGYVTSIVNFAIANAFWTFLLMLILSYLMRWKSTNCKHAPL